MRENKDYELVPGEDDAWHVRILTGDFVESVIRFDRVALSGSRLTFSFTLVSSPDITLTVNDRELQETAAAILSDVMASAAAE